MQRIDRKQRKIDEGIPLHNPECTNDDQDRMREDIEMKHADAEVSGEPPPTAGMKRGNEDDEVRNTRPIIQSARKGMSTSRINS